MDVLTKKHNKEGDVNGSQKIYFVSMNGTDRIQREIIERIHGPNILVIREDVGFKDEASIINYICTRGASFVYFDSSSVPYSICKKVARFKFDNFGIFQRKNDLITCYHATGRKMSKVFEESC